MYIKNYICGHIVEVVELDRVGGAIGIYRKLDKDNMVNVNTGEVIKVNHNDSRKDDIASLKKSIRRLRMIINANFSGNLNELFITLTYSENMTDLKRLYSDFNKFIKRLRYKYGDINFEYIAVPEPQLRGAWHIHLLLKAVNKEVLYISNDKIAELWRQGFTKTERLEQVDNVGAYLSAYLTDLKNDNCKSKGARLYLYPSGMQLYRSSRGIKKPDVIEGNIGIDDIYKVYESSYDIKDGDKVVNTVTYKQYNMKRCIIKV